MAKMNQPGTDRGIRGETGEKIPAGDRSSDNSGERKARLVGGVAMGKADDIRGREASHLGQREGHTGELNTGRADKEVYVHAKGDYRGDPSKYRYGEKG